MFEIEEGFYEAGLEKFQGRDSILRGDLELSDQFDMFKNMSKYNFSDCIIFMDQCTTFYNKKCKKSEESIELQNTILNMIRKFCLFIEGIEEGFKKVNKEVYKSYGVINFKKRLFKYFGSNILSVFELSLSIVENPKRRLEKIGKIFENN